MRVVDTLDLHGKTKAKAISSTTWFLDQQRQQQRNRNHNKSSSSSSRVLYVRIITGTGSHSSAQQGPVLRNAIETLLKKRQMNYTLERTKGSFLVDLMSGFELEGAPKLAEDTKVVLVNGESDSDNLILPRTRRPHRANNNNNKKNFLRQQRSTTSSSSDTAATAANSSDGEGDSPFSFPLPSEVLNDDEQIRNACILSAKETIARKRDESLDNQNLESALQKSLSLLEEDKLKQREEEELLQQVLKESMDSLKEKEEEILMLKKRQGTYNATKGGLNDDTSEEEDLMKRVMRESELAMQKYDEEKEQEEKELERVLQLSAMYY